MAVSTFISFLLEKSNGKKEYQRIFTSTQILIRQYREQYLLEEQLIEEWQNIDALIEADMDNRRGTVQSTRERLALNHARLSSARQTGLFLFVVCCVF